MGEVEQGRQRIFRTQTAIAFVEEAHLVRDDRLTLADVVDPQTWTPGLLRAGTLVWAIVGDGRDLLLCVGLTHDGRPVLEPFVTRRGPPAEPAVPVVPTQAPPPARRAA